MCHFILQAIKLSNTSHQTWFWMKIKQLKYQNNFEKYFLFFLNILKKLQNWGERGWVNNSTPSYQVQQVPDKREEKHYLQEVCVTHFLVIRKGAHQLSFPKHNIPKHSQNTISITIFSTTRTGIQAAEMYSTAHFQTSLGLPPCYHLPVSAWLTCYASY